VAITDICAGLFCNGAILSALYAREKTGRGQQIDTSLLESQVATLANIGSNYLIAGMNNKRMGTAHTSIVPYQAFPTSNGHIVVGALNEAQFVRLCKVLNKPELSIDPRFKENKDRVKNRVILIDLLKQYFGQKETKEWIQQLELAKVPCSPINSMKEVFNDPQVIHRKMIEEVDHPTAGKIKLAGIPVKYSDTQPTVRTAPPTLGQHTFQVLNETLGYSKERIQQLADKGVVKLGDM